MEMRATYTKLRSGEWGVKLQGEFQNAAQYPGVLVTKKDGTTKTERITKVVYCGQGITLCAIEQRSRRPSASRYEDNCHTDGNCSSCCDPKTCPCGDGSWFRCC